MSLKGRKWQQGISVYRSYREREIISSMLGVRVIPAGEKQDGKKPIRPPHTIALVTIR